MDPVLVAVFGAIAAVIATGVGGLFIRMRSLEGLRKAADVRLGELEDKARKADELDKKVGELRVCIAENYVRREDYVPALSLIGSKIDSMAQMLTRVDTRLEPRP